MPNGPLEGVRVLDLTRALAGPYCTMLLADLGAEVLKAERPGHGDDSRGYLPFAGKESGYFATVNRNKASFTLNLKLPEGQEICRRLATQVDVLVENFTPGTTARWNIDYPSLSTLNPRLIYCSISGYGQTGPDAHKPAFDITCQARGGLMSITGTPETGPLRVGSSIADIATGLFSSNAICAALYRRTFTGRGDFIDVGMTDCVFSILENAVSRAQMEGRAPQLIGSRHPSAAPYDVYPSKDGFLAIACVTESTWRSLCKAIGKPDLATDPSFKTNANRMAHLEELTHIISSWTRSFSTEEAVSHLEEWDVPCSAVHNVQQLLTDSQLLARNMLPEVELANGYRLKLPGNPMKFATYHEGSFERSPLLGEQNEKVYSELLGFSSKEIEDLHKKGVL